MCEKESVEVCVLVELIQSNKGLLYPIFAKFLFYLASISLQADRTRLHTSPHCSTLCVCVHTCAFFEGDVLSQSLSDVSYITFIAVVWP